VPRRDVVAVMAATGREPRGPAVPPHWNVNLAVDDADAIAARAADLGGNVLMGPVDTPGFRSAVLLDPQGAAFSVSQPAARGVMTALPMCGLPSGRCRARRSCFPR
jgi:uncharacterized protein